MSERELRAVELAQYERILHLKRELEIQSQARIEATNRAGRAEATLTRLRELATEWAKEHKPHVESDWNYGFDEGGRTAGEWVLEILDGTEVKP